MRDTWDSFVKFFVSLKLTVALLALSIILIFAATLDQVHLGVWAVQEKYFRTFFVLWNVKGFPVPVFPGGYFIGGLLLINLVCAHAYRFRLSWKKSGIFLTHLGLILLLVGELLTSLWQQEYKLQLDQGQTRNYSESYRDSELAIIDASDPKWDEVVAIPEKRLVNGDPIQVAKLPFRVVVNTYYPNATMQMRDQLPNAPAAPATRDIGARLALIPMAITYKQDETNLPAAVIELIGPEGSLGTWLVSSMLQPQTFDYAGKTWRLALRFKRNYQPYSITLLKFSHDIYMGSDIPKNFSSKIHLRSDDGKTDRDVLIYMNNPLRYGGMTFYQQSFANNDQTSILQVVRNPSWMLPYLACILMGLGLVIQFGLHLFGFFAKRRKAASS
ncbi:MAG TPA: cytochrome c biogenesis protein ResB [Rariglobus sp.]|jgi:hypothetical protein|nr:cytochrome c biogenesis protein ResB [Rariglobus sp.]